MVVPQTSETGDTVSRGDALTSVPASAVIAAPIAPPSHASSVGVDSECSITQSVSSAASDKSESVYHSVHSGYESDAASSVSSRSFTPSSDASFLDADNPPHGAYLPPVLPPQYDVGGYSFDSAQSFDSFDEATFAQLSKNLQSTGATAGLGYEAPFSPPMSHYYARRRENQHGLAGSLRGTVNSESSIPSFNNDDLPTFNLPLLSTSITVASAHPTPDNPVQAEKSNDTSAINLQPLVPTSVASAHTLDDAVQAKGIVGASVPVIHATSAGQTSDASEPIRVASVQTNGPGAPQLIVCAPFSSTMEDAHPAVAQQTDGFFFPETVFNLPAGNSPAPRRSGRTVVPSSRNAVANEIGGQRLGKRR